MKHLIILWGLLGSILLLNNTAWSQNSLDGFLEGISKNNKSIIAHDQLIEAKKLEYSSGLYLTNPTVEYDYMKGSPANAGNQTDITAIQSFDFPSAYGKRKGLSNASIDQLEIFAKSYQQDVLFEAKQLYLELIYLNKYADELRKRKADAETLQKAFQRKYELGDGTLLDVNKVKINSIGAQNALSLAESRVSEITQKLVELNGGVALTVTDTLYPLVTVLPVLDTIFSEALLGDYTLKSIQQDQQISAKQAELNKALSLPKLELGYRHQAILGQKFNGFHAGISIPLFENKNKVQAANQQTHYYEALEVSHKNEHHNELEALYNKTIALKQSVDQYNALFSQLNSEALLLKALNLGQISTIEYFMELGYYYNVYDEFLKLEQEYYLAMSRLRKYAL
jgi:cobalt-zinc-cadmium efflux system outer membrane protein